MPEGVEICVTTTDLPLLGEQRDVEVETSVLEEESFPEQPEQLENATCSNSPLSSSSPSSYECDICGLVLSQRSTYGLHKEFCHVDEAYYACEFCPASALHWTEFYIHQCTNLDNKPLSCPHCHQIVSTKKQLSVHEEIHTLQRRFKTKKLDNYFARKLEEAEDPSVDWGAKPFLCGVCGKV